MQILLDEHLDVRLKFLFDNSIKAFTVKDKKWQGKLNGELLKLIIDNRIDVFITNDKSLRYQQNVNKLPLTIIELNTKGNQYHITEPFVIAINKYLLSNKFRQAKKKTEAITFYIIWNK